METAKVDIQKLQLLNDRITQTIDALNQVRMSVHGLQTSSPQALGAIQAGPQGYGLSHTGGFVQPGLGQAAYTQQAGFAQPGFAQQGFVQGQLVPQQYLIPQIAGGHSMGAQAGMVPNPWAAQGLSHTEALSRQMVDPSWQARMIQTFPYVRYDTASGVNV